MCWGRIHGLAAVTPEGKCAVLRLGDFSLARGPQAAEAGGLGHRPTAWALSCLLLLIPLPRFLGPTVPLTAEKSTGSSQHLSTVTHSSQQDLPVVYIRSLHCPGLSPPRTPIALKKDPHSSPWLTRPTTDWAVPTSPIASSFFSLSSPFCWSWNRLASFLPQGLCMCCIILREYSSSSSSHDP